MTVPPRSARRAWWLLAAAFAGAGAVRADGAFPDEFSIHFPPADPDRIIVGANFGVMISEDRGATWRYACEPYVTEDSSNPLAMINVIYYQVGAADGEILQVANNYKLRRSGDDGCTWATAGGALDSLQAIDLFPSPTDPQFVVAVGVNPTGSGSSLVASHNGGATFDATLRTVSAQLFTSVEISGSTIYATVSAPNLAQIWRSDDSGATWPATNMYNLPTLPGGIVPQARIVAIDVEDPSIVYVRLIGSPYDAIAIITGSGQSSKIELQVTNNALSAFARGTDKTLYVGTADGKLYVRPPPSPPGNADPPFAAPIAAPHFRCLGQRFGSNDLYACGYFFQDGFSVGVSHDRGQTFQKVMSLPDMLGPFTCTTVATACAAHWARIQSVFATDGGTTSPDGGTTSPKSSGGTCGTVGAGGLAAIALLAALVRTRARRIR